MFMFSGWFPMCSLLKDFEQQIDRYRVKRLASHCFLPMWWHSLLLGIRLRVLPPFCSIDEALYIDVVWVIKQKGCFMTCAMMSCYLLHEIM